MGAVIVAFLGLLAIIAGFTLAFATMHIAWLLLVLAGFFMVLCLHDW